MPWGPNVAPCQIGNLHTQVGSPHLPKVEALHHQGRQSESKTQDISRLLDPEPSGEWPPRRHWLPQLCPAPWFPPQSLTLGLPLSLHPDGGEGLSPTQEDMPFPTSNGGTKLVRAPGTQGTCSPTLPGKTQSEVPGGKKRRVLAAAAIFPNGTSKRSRD